MPHRSRTELPRWLTSATVAWTGASLALLAVILGGGFLWFEQRAIQTRELQSAEMYARVLQDQAERTFNTVDVVLSSLADSVDVDAPTRLSEEFTQAQQGMPFLRSLSAMDGNGRVLASSVAGNIGTMVDLARIRTPADGMPDRLGPLVHGRDLADASVARAAGSSARSFAPLVRRASSPAGGTVYLVATLNLDFFGNDYERTLADPGRAAALLSLDATLLAATSNVALSPGEAATRLRFFQDVLPTRESGSFVGAGVDGGQVVAAFRVLRKRPLAVLVERDQSRLSAELARTGAWLAGVCGLALSVMGALVVMAWRSLRSHELVRAALNTSRDHVIASERSLRTLVQSVHEWIFRADTSGRITFVNRRWQQISGRPDSAALGRRLADLCTAADRARIDALFEPGAAGSAEAIMVQIATEQGDLRTIEVSVASVTEDNGAIAGFAGFAVDVSERQLARQRLESQLAFTARLLDVSPTPLFVKDVQGRFLTVNRAWLDLMDFELDDVIGRDSTDLFGGEAPFHHDHDQRLLLSEERVVYENRLLRPGHPARDTVVTKVRFTHADGTPAGSVGSIVDVTAFRDTERRIREARDAAELASRAKSEFLANISHELRTPLQSIIGFSELGADLSRDTPHFLEMFGDIQTGGQRMLTLVNGLLDVSQMDSAVGSLALRRSDVRQLLSAAMTQVGAASQPPPLFELNAPPDPLLADVEAARFQQVLQHVLANAVRFAPVGSRIDIDCTDGGPAGIAITIRDRGPGIPDAELESIFDAFVQSSRTRDGSGGRGLGLTISRKIMNAHGGRIEALNAPDGGALIRLWLPACASSSRDDEDVASPVPSGTERFESEVH